MLLIGVLLVADSASLAQQKSPKAKQPSIRELINQLSHAEKADAAVKALVEDTIAEGVEAAVSPSVRETVEAVRELSKPSGDEQENTNVTNKAVAEFLKIDSAAAWRRCQVALKSGYIRNEEERKGRPAKLVVGDKLPRETSILPEQEVLRSKLQWRLYASYKSKTRQ